MANVPQPNIRWRGAHPNNFTYGRPGASLNGDQTFHHVVGTRESAVIVFNNPTRGASSHYVVGGDIIDQCVAIENTAWCDGNWEHNLRAITVEHEGGQNGNGPYSEEMYQNAIKLCAWLRQNYGISRYVRHRDVSLKSTACPGGLDVERIWNEATNLINAYANPTPPPQPEWLRNRSAIEPKTVYSQKDGLFVYNLNDGSNPSDSRRFPINQNFLVAGQTIVNGREFWITKSSMDGTVANGIAKNEVADTMWTPAPTPTPPQPTTPDWVDALVNTDNVTMYVLRATPLVDLENGRPYVGKDGKEVWYQAGDVIKDVSAHTVVNEITYQLTEYSYKEIEGKRYANANGIKSSDLSIDPLSVPPGTPGNPEPLPTTTTTTETTTQPEPTTTTTTDVEPEPPTTTTTTTVKPISGVDWATAIIAALVAAAAALWSILIK